MNDKPIKKLHTETESFCSGSDASEDLDTLSISPEERKSKFKEFVEETKSIRIRISDLNKDLKVDFNNFPDTNEDIIALFDTLVVQFEFKKRIKKKWTNQEKVVFIWVVYKYSKQAHKTVEEMNTQDWINICKILGWRADPVEIIYKWFNLQKSIIQMENWTPDEDDMLADLVKLSKSKNKWNTIAKQMYEKSKGKYMRLSKHCRERWKNHLDPSIKKEPWTPSENLVILTSILNHGKKWSKISKQMNGRPENSIKNHFIKLLSQNKIERSEDTSSPQFRNKLKELIDKYSDSNQKDENKVECATPQDKENPPTQKDEKSETTVDENAPTTKPGDHSETSEFSIKEKEEVPFVASEHHINEPPQNYQESEDYSRQAGQYYREPAHYLGSEPGQFSREPGPFSREPGPFTRESGHFPREPAQFARDPSQLARERGSFARETGPFTREPGPFTREPGPFAREPGHYPGQPGQFTSPPGQYANQSSFPHFMNETSQYMREAAQYMSDQHHYQDLSNKKPMPFPYEHPQVPKDQTKTLPDSSLSHSMPGPHFPYFNKRMQEFAMNYPGKYKECQSCGCHNHEANYNSNQTTPNTSSQAPQNYWPSSTYPCITYVPVITHKPLPMSFQQMGKQPMKWNTSVWGE